MTTRTEAMAAAGAVLAEGWLQLLERSPRESAEAAYVSGGPSIAELEVRITRLVYGDEAADALLLGRSA